MSAGVLAVLFASIAGALLLGYALAYGTVILYAAVDAEEDEAKRYVDEKHNSVRHNAHTKHI